MSGDVGLAANGAVTIQADSVENTMLANMTQGTVKVGGTSDAPTDLTASGDGYILVGDGTDINSVAVSGDIALANDGAVTIQADSVENSMLANISRGSVKVGGASDAPTDLTASGDGYILVGDGTDIASVAVSGDVALANNGAVTIQADSVENTMLANISRGSVKVGGASDAPTDLNASGDGYMLIGDGTDIASVAISGDIGITNAGLVTIQADSVENTMLANMTRGTVKVGGADNAPTDLDAKTSGYILVGDGTDIASVAVSGDVSLAAGGGVTIASDAVESSMVSPLYMKVATGALSSGNANAFAFAWQNPEDAKILVHRVIIDVTTAGGTGGSVLDVGVVADATSTAADIIDDLDLNATGVTDHLLVAGAGLGGVHKVDEADGTNDYITGKILTQNAASLEGSYYIMYTEVRA